MPIRIKLKIRLSTGISTSADAEHEPVVGKDVRADEFAGENTHIVQRHTDPSFHEVRALGAEMYRQTGMPEPEIQRLLGHRMAAMTAHYLDGHDTIVRARAGLKLPDDEQE